MTRLTPEDIVYLKEASHVRIHPKRPLAVYVLSEFQETARVSTLCFMGPEAEQYEAISGRLGRHPEWAPAGDALAYAEGSSFTSQLHVVDRLGRDVTEPMVIAGDVTTLAWSPDGRRLAVEYLAASDGSEGGIRVIKRLRHHFDSRGYLGERRWVVAVWDLDAGVLAWISTAPFHHFAPSWSPDGASLALVTTRSPDWDREWVWDLYTVDLAADAWQKVTDSSGVTLYPVWAPDGHRIAFLHNHSPYTGSTADYHLHEARDDCGNWRVRCLAHDLDRGAALIHEPPEPGGGKPVYTPDGSRILWVVNQGGMYDLMAADQNGHQTFWAHHQGWPSLSSDGSLRAQLQFRPDGPPIVSLVDAQGAVTAQVDDNPWLRARTLCRGPEEFQLTTDDGRTVSAWIWSLSPRAIEGPWLLQFHGGPHGAFGPYFSHTQQILTSHGYLVAALNYRGSAGFGQDFGDLVHANWGPQEGQDGIAVIHALAHQGWVSEDAPVGVFGPSYGGFMTQWMLSHYPDRVKAGVAISTVSHLITSALGIDHWESLAGDQGGLPWEIPDYYTRHSPLMDANYITAPLLLLHGEEDMTCPLIEAEMMFSALRIQGKDVELVRYVGESHAFHRAGRSDTMADAHHRMLAWFSRLGSDGVRGGFGMY